MGDILHDPQAIDDVVAYINTLPAIRTESVAQN